MSRSNENAKTLAGTEAWEIVRVQDASALFRALPTLLPDATTAFVECVGMASAVADALSRYTEVSTYEAPLGVVWPTPTRLRLKTSADLFVRLGELAEQHAGPEICDNFHVYAFAAPLLQWFDAFDDPIRVSKRVPVQRIQRLCKELGVQYRECAAVDPL